MTLPPARPAGAQPGARPAARAGNQPRRPGWLVALPWLAAIAVWAAGPQAAWAQPLAPGQDTLPTSPASPIGDAVRGRQLYMHGHDAGGQPLQAWRVGMGRLPAAASACAACHRPSGMGGTEGGVLVPPIAGPLLFAPGRPPAGAARLNRQWLRHQTRSAYTPALLARALADGLDADGLPLSSTMPRYALDAQALADLAAFLRQRGSTPPPGLVGQTLHLATVFTPEAPPGRRAAVRQAMQAWSAGLRLGALQVAWHAWDLHGAPAGWPAQLDTLAATQPVYALLSGAGGSDWDAVEALCTARALPCLFPVIDQPPAAPADPRHWAFYLSGGAPAEARLLAQHLRSLSPWPARVLQVHDGAAGAAAAAALRQALAGPGGLPVEDIAFDPSPDPGAPAVWQARPPVPHLQRPAGGDTVVVLWLRSDAVQAWLAAQPAPPAGAPRLVLSAQLAPPAATAVPAAWRPRIWWASLRSEPWRRDAGAALSLVRWQQQLQLQDGLDAAALDDVHAATFFFADAMAQLRGSTDPEHLLERLEVAVDRRPAGAAYGRLSLGPGQRIAAQTGQVLGYRPPAHVHLLPVSGVLRADE